MSDVGENKPSDPPVVQETGGSSVEVLREVRVRSTSWSGPLPAPADLQLFEEIVPGAADRILTLTEKQSEHRMDLERSVVSENLKQSKLGLIAGFCSISDGYIRWYLPHLPWARLGRRHSDQYTSIYPRRILRATKNGNGNTFVRGGHGGPRRTATAELQLQLLFVHEGPRRTAKNTSFDPRRTRRATKNGNGNTFVHGGHGGPRRTATATPLSAEDTEGRGERQLQNCNCSFFLSTKDREVHLYLSTKDTKGRGERHLWSPQIVVVGHENLAGDGPILPAGA